MSKRKIVHPLIKRNRALEKTRARFEGKPFVFGKTDCLKLVRYHLVHMGHRGLPVPPSYSTALGARKALKAQGVATLSELLDRYLEPIAPAEMLPGDVCMGAAEAGDGDDGFGETLGLSLGQKVWGWHPDAAAIEVLEVGRQAIQRAWRA
ncbi:hypothetical protein GGQ97_002302 [Sphingomonas kaistensis]|uniref:DUF6950 domain-containing protein n=1 Tax=Sphingomonas kaistensis TaxID=298708 RepID=A0A7X5Y793_9SPHN|nr:hypothetical protein [Sphingomonas kaistensis]NJC06509.1 hypothetical protein [Sphingomonas kaistensis]